MKKEICVVCIIFILIVIINIISQKYLSKSVDETKKQLDQLSLISEQYLNSKENSTINDNPDIKEQIKNTNDEWNKYKKNLSLYIEHDELEKVDTSIVLLDSFINVEDYEEAIPEIKECMYILDHIREKQKINISNLL